MRGKKLYGSGFVGLLNVYIYCVNKICKYQTGENFMQHKIQVVSEGDGTMVVALGGEVDASSYEEFDAVIFSHYNRHKCDVVFDCAELDFIDSTILGGIVKVYKTLAADGHKLVVKYLKPRIRKLFEICALDKLVGLE